MESPVPSKQIFQISRVEHLLSFNPFTLQNEKGYPRITSNQVVEPPTHAMLATSSALEALPHRLKVLYRRQGFRSLSMPSIPAVVIYSAY